MVQGRRGGTGVPSGCCWGGFQCARWLAALGRVFTQGCCWRWRPGLPVPKAGALWAQRVARGSGHRCAAAILRCSRQAGAAQTRCVRCAHAARTCAASQMTKARCARPPAWRCAPRRPHKAKRCAHSTPALEVAVVVRTQGSPSARVLHRPFAVAGAARGGRLLRWPWHRSGGQASVSALRQHTRGGCLSAAPAGRGASSTALAPGPVPRRSRRSRPPQWSPHGAAPAAAWTGQPCSQATKSAPVATRTGPPCAPHPAVQTAATTCR